MSSMNNLINAYFAQNTPSQEDLEKQAHVELFAKLAADNGVDLEKLSEDQIAYLWQETFKTAEEETPAEKKEEAKEEAKKDEKKDEEAEKKAAAFAEYTEKRAAAAKLAEAEYIGRYMAHAMADEIRKIASKTEEAPAPEAKTAAPVAAPAPEPAPEKIASGAGSALDQLAAEWALQKVADAKMDVKVAAARLSAVLTLGARESEKVAHAESPEAAVEVRSLELLEAAGYKVSWN